MDLRFPGHKDVPVVDGVPEGWTKDRLGNYMDVKRGGSPRPIQNFLSDHGYKWLKISDVTAHDGFYILDVEEHIIESGLSKTVYLKKGEMVLSNSATPGIPRILDVDSCIHDGWLYFPKSMFTNEYMLLMFREERKNIVSIGTGAIFTNLKTDIVRNFIHLIPPQTILNEFQKAISPLFKEMLCKQRMNKQMFEARDRLLPKLMSGEIAS